MNDGPEIGDDGGLPRWVKISLIVVLLLALLVVVAMLIGGGHGPRRHSGAAANPGTSLSSYR
jgi:hypothetical protein